MPNTLLAHHLPLVRHIADWDRTIRSIAGARASELDALIANGRLVPLPGDTGIAVEGDYGTLLRVRVTDGAHSGLTGWLPNGRRLRIAA